MEDPKNIPDDDDATSRKDYSSDEYLSKAYWPSAMDNIARPDGSERPKNRPTSTEVLGKDASAVLLLVRGDGVGATWEKVRLMHGSGILTVVQDLINRGYLTYDEHNDKLAITERVYETMRL